MPKLIESQAKASLDKSIEQLDENIENKLAQIRVNALNTQVKPHVIKMWPVERKYFASAFSAIALFLLFSSDFINTELDPVTEPLHVQNELTLIEQTPYELTQNALVEDPALLEDLEFIYWLSQEYEEV